MRIVLDIGNSEVTVGLTDHDVLRGRWRLTTTAERTPDEWALALEAFALRAGHSPEEIHAACVASVAPSVTAAMVAAVRRGMTQRIGLVTPSSELPLVLDVDEPWAVGADRIANGLGALDQHPGDAIVIDLGTATTFDCITADRRFIGGSIMPGLRTSAEQLIRRAAKLTATELIAPTRAIGRRTDEHIRAGVLFGAADAIDGMVDRIRAEWPTEAVPTVIATGGLASLVAPLSRTVTVVDADLTLHGLRVAADALGLPG
jgi:type III pantothenate kinase